jgi:hypothetical protein
MESVRERYYHGFCAHEPQTMAVIAEFRAKRSEIDGVFATIPGMTDRTRQGALAYLAGFWSDIGTDKGVAKMLARCQPHHHRQLDRADPRAEADPNRQQDIERVARALEAILEPHRARDAAEREGQRKAVLTTTGRMRIELISDWSYSSSVRVAM